MGQIKTIIGAKAHETLQHILARAFPSALPTEENVDSLVEAMWANYRPEFAQLGVKPRGEYPLEAAAKSVEAFVEHGPKAPSPPQYPLYTVSGHHERTRDVQGYTPMRSAFIGQLQMVRVPLPQKLAGNEVLVTQLGEVKFKDDHMAGSVELIGKMYGGAEYLGYVPARVDLITGARRELSRFTPVALYLGYKNAADTAPSFYVLEGGTATGQPMVLFFSKIIGQTRPYYSMFEPTPFSAKDHIYQGTLTMNGDEPQTVEIKARYGTERDWYITITADYALVPSSAAPSKEEPWMFTIEAVLRSASIAQAMGVNVFTYEGLQVIIASLGDKLEWVIPPQMGSGAPGGDR